MLKKISRSILIFALALAFAANVTAQNPLGIETTYNRQYFNYNGKTLALVGVSGDYLPHVAQTQFPCGLANYKTSCIGKLNQQALNKMRMWMTLNHSPGQKFNSTGNFVPYPDEEPFQYIGVVNGQHTWNLKAWDTNFFDHVKQVLTDANAAGVFVEITLFAPWDGDNLNTGPWKHNQQLYNGTLQSWSFQNTKYFVAFDNVSNDLDSQRQKLRQVQLDFVDKIATELNSFNNFYWEIANEPELNGEPDLNATINWHNFIADEIYRIEDTLNHRHHLIAANYSLRPTITNAATSTKIDIINAHYLRLNGPTGPNNSIPEAPRFGAIKFIQNFNGGVSPTQSDKVFGFNEDRPTGNVTNNATPEGARAGAWEFMVDEGGEVDHLRYDTGSAYDDVLVQFGFIRRVIGGLPLKSMKRYATPSWIQSGLPAYPAYTTMPMKYWSAMESSVNTNLLYIHHSQLTGSPNDKYLPNFGTYSEDLTLQNLGAAGCFQYFWFNPAATNVDPGTTLHSLNANILPTTNGIPGSGTFTWPGSGTVRLQSPNYSYDVVLKIVRCP